MKTQNIFKKYYAIYKFHSAHGFIEGLSRVWSIFTELDLFDFKRGINTRTIKVVSLGKKTYMPYWPAFTNVVIEMLKFSHNYYISAIRYSDLDRKTVFVDFGAGLGKTPILAAETGKFNLSAGIEIDDELVEVAEHNFSKIAAKNGLAELFILKGNVESEVDIKNLVNRIKSYGITPSESTLFIFNKNSYGPEVLDRSLELIEKHFSSIVYLYQNPIHHYVLSDRHYIEFGQDSRSSIEHKNYKYKLFFKHKY